MLGHKSKQSAQDILKQEAGGIRTLGKFELWLITAIAVSWALFQLSLAGFFILNSPYERAIHLAFAISLLFLTSPCIKKPLKKLSFLSATTHIPAIDYILAITASLAALYLAFDYEGIGMRLGMPLLRDLIFGVVLVVLLLEAARRIIGPALPIIAIAFTGYAFLGPHMPDFMAFKGVSLTKYLSNITLSTEGIYGIPLGVSSSIVYLFVLLGALLDKAGAGRFFT
ncbi:MAG: TRAP transporter permease, partial [Desulfobacula sp.]|nr:TRAP transporter permease [Desulfobacula sp.]